MFLPNVAHVDTDAIWREKRDSTRLRRGVSPGEESGVMDEVELLPVCALDGFLDSAGRELSLHALVGGLGDCMVSGCLSVAAGDSSAGTGFLADRRGGRKPVGS